MDGSPFCFANIKNIHHEGHEEHEEHEGKTTIRKCFAFGFLCALCELCGSGLFELGLRILG